VIPLGEDAWMNARHALNPSPCLPL
jgi:hypothetical protein